jgi:hypothetical protein
MSAMNRISLSLLIGFATFIIAFVALMGFAMIRFTYYSGPIPFAPYAVPIPLLIGVLAGMITFRMKTSN